METIKLLSPIFICIAFIFGIGFVAGACVDE